MSKLKGSKTAANLAAALLMSNSLHIVSVKNS
jgi:hypothetical protein